MAAFLPHPASAAAPHWSFTKRHQPPRARGEQDAGGIKGTKKQKPGLSSGRGGSHFYPHSSSPHHLALTIVCGSDWLGKDYTSSHSYMLASNLGWPRSREVLSNLQWAKAPSYLTRSSNTSPADPPQHTHPHCSPSLSLHFTSSAFAQLLLTLHVSGQCHLLREGFTDHPFPMARSLGSTTSLLSLPL